jgi:FeS assembly protein IscX
VIFRRDPLGRRPGSRVTSGWLPARRNEDGDGRPAMPRKLTWRDAQEIGIALQEKFPRRDPLTVRFTDLHHWVCGLEGFDDDPQGSDEKKLEAIQMAWYEEYADSE